MSSPDSNNGNPSRGRRGSDQSSSSSPEKAGPRMRQLEEEEGEAEAGPHRNGGGGGGASGEPSGNGNGSNNGNNSNSSQNGSPDRKPARIRERRDAVDEEEHPSPPWEDSLKEFIVVKGQGGFSYVAKVTGQRRVGLATTYRVDFYVRRGRGSSAIFSVNEDDLGAEVGESEIVGHLPTPTPLARERFEFEMDMSQWKIGVSRRTDVVGEEQQ